VKRHDDSDNKIFLKGSQISMTAPFELPENFDWKPWITRWERMQDGYIVKRAQRFAMLIDLIARTQRRPSTIVELGCGPGSLTIRLLKAFPKAHIVGIDLDPTLLPLAERRTLKYHDRAQLYLRDLRDTAWIQDIPFPVDAVVSSTALHWLNKRHLKQLYRQIAALLGDRGIFLNADHAGSDFGRVQRFWEQRRKSLQSQYRNPRAEDWSTFINTYLEELGDEARTLREQMLRPWEGNDRGFPLSWHFDHLLKAGFKHVDCFWRGDCDAIYGGIVRKKASL
jgi:SAM-dependent methyltransferase